MSTKCNVKFCFYGLDSTDKFVRQRRCRISPSISSFSSHADSVAEVFRAAFALELPLAFPLAALNLLVVAGWLAASR